MLISSSILALSICIAVVSTLWLGYILTQFDSFTEALWGAQWTLRGGSIYVLVPVAELMLHVIGDTVLVGLMFFGHADSGRFLS